MTYPDDEELSGGLLGRFIPKGAPIRGLLDDPNAAMAIGAALMQARKGQSFEALGKGLMSAIQIQRQGAQDRMQQESQRLELEQRQRALQRRQQIDALGPQYMRPGITPLTPNDDEGNAMPSSPPSMDWQGYTQALTGIDPMMGMQMQGQLAQMNKPDLATVAPGATLYDRRAGRPVYQAPEKTPDWLDPRYIEAQQQIRAAGRPQVNVNTKVDAFTPASEEAQKEFMKSSRATYDQLKQAPVALASIEKAKALIPQARAFMGPGGEGLLGAAKFLNARLGLSINTEGVRSAEELRTRIFMNVMDNLKKMDAQPSQMQQKIMMESLGTLGTDPNAIANILDAYGDVIRGKVEGYNREVSGAAERGVKFPYDPVIRIDAREYIGPLKKNQTALYQARQAIKGGKNREAVIERLREQGFDPSGL